MTIRRDRGPASEAGFSLLETLVAMSILATGLMGMAGVFTLGMAHLAASSAGLIAREKAREAVESVHTARDMRVVTWSQVRNVSQGGVFLAGAQSLRTAGPDGLVNTADDGALEMSLSTGPDNVLGTADDLQTPLNAYTRQIEISDIVTNGVPSLSLRQLRVTIRYNVGQMTRSYVLTTFISSIS